MSVSAYNETTVLVYLNLFLSLLLFFLSVLCDRNLSMMPLNNYERRKSALTYFSRCFLIIIVICANIDETNYFVLKNTLCIFYQLLQIADLAIGKSFISQILCRRLANAFFLLSVSISTLLYNQIYNFFSIFSLYYLSLLFGALSVYLALALYD